jgi:solute carrier family 13 (sodium-dependent dicarboxylate transporter), member 2/3/5
MDFSETALIDRQVASLPVSETTKVVDSGAPRRVLVGQVLSLLVPALVWWAPMSLDPRAKHALAIASFMIIAWMTEAFDHSLTGLVGCYLLWTLDVAKFETAFGGFASPSPWFIFGALLLGMTVTKSGLGQRLAYLVLARTGTTYSRVLLGFVLVSFLLTLVVPSGSACITIKATIALGLIQAFGLLPGSNIARAIFLMLTYSASLFNKMVIAGSSAILVRGVVQEMAQSEILWSRWLLAFLPCTVVTILVLWKLALVLFPAEKDISIQSDEFFRSSLEQLGPWTRQEKKAAALLGATIGLWMTDFAHHLSPSVIGIGAGLFAALPHVGVLQAKDVKKVNYGPVFFVAAALSLGEVLVNTQAMDVLTIGMFSWMNSVITDNSSFCVAAYWTGFVYHLFAGSGIAMMSTSVPPLVNLAQSHGLNPLPIAMIWAFSGAAKLFVYQSSTLILGYSYGYFSNRDLFRFGACMTVIEFLVLFLLVTFYWPLIGLG